MLWCLLLFHIGKLPSAQQAQLATFWWTPRCWPTSITTIGIWDRLIEVYRMQGILGETQNTSWHNLWYYKQSTLCATIQ